MTKQLFEKLVADEEGHYDEFNHHMEHIRRFGLSDLALQTFQKQDTKSATAG